LQRVIAANPYCLSLPETAFFLKLLGRRHDGKLLRRFVVPEWRIRKAFRALHTASPEELAIPSIPSIGGYLPTRWAADRFVAHLDGLARRAGKSAWVEKTPRHYRHVRTMQSLVKDAHVIHMIRDGEAMVGSMLDRARKNPQSFGQREGVQFAVNIWNEAINHALSDARSGRAVVVSYEDLAIKTESVARGVCDLLAIDFSPNMISDNDAVAGIVRSEETWKEELSQRIEKKESKLDALVSPEEKLEISSSLDYETYNKLSAFKVVGDVAE